MNTFEIPKGWQSDMIENVVEIVSTTGKKIKNKDYRNEGLLPIIDQGKSLIGGFTNNTDYKINIKPVIVFGDHTRIIKFIDFDFVAGADGIKILKPDNKFNPKLFYYFLQAIELPSRGYGRHFKLLKESMILIPPLETQKEIVQKLDYVFIQIDEKKKTILELQKKKILEIEKLLKNSWNYVFEYLINDAKGVNVPLGELLSDIKLGSNSKAITTKNGIPVLRMPNIQNGNINYSSLKYTKFPVLDEEKYLLKRGDILVNRTNSPELVGKSAVFDKDEKFAFASYLIRIRGDLNRVDPHFLVTYINSNLGRKYIESVYVKTAGQANINSQHLKSMPILLPDLNKQKIIMEKITPLLYSELSELSTLLKQSLKSQDGLKQKFNDLSKSILQTAFSGKLVN